MLFVKNKISKQLDFPLVGYEKNNLNILFLFKINQKVHFCVFLITIKSKK